VSERIDEPRFRDGAGRVCLDFIRTLRYRGAATAVEELADPSALASWIQQFGPGAGPFASVDNGQVERARELREAIYELIRSVRGGEPCISCARERINDAAASPVPAPGLQPTGRLRWHADDPVAATLALVARDALDLATSGAAARIRECAGGDCQALFLDHSRPGVRRWCSMGTCGNRAKKDVLRAKNI
jgi:predicted RNA-binding Zn ribbon-like protein